MREIPCRDLITVTSDYLSAAMMAEGVLSFVIVNVADINITYSIIDGDISRHSQGFNRRRGGLQHLKIRMKSGKMPGNIRPQVF